MVHKKITRKELKEDRVAQLIVRVWLMVEENARTIAAASGLFVLLVLLIWGGSAFFKWRERRAFTALDQQLQAYDLSLFSEIGPTEGAEQSDEIEGFAEVIDDYSGTRAALLSHYYAANAAIHEREIDKAIEHIEIFLDRNASPRLVPLAELKLCKALALKGDYERALELCEKAGVHGDTPLPDDYLLYEKATLFERWGKITVAIDLYKQLLTDYRGSLYSQIARQRIEALTEAQVSPSPSPIGQSEPIAPSSNQ